jgi:hypothetical protein
LTITGWARSVLMFVSTGQGAPPGLEHVLGDRAALERWEKSPEVLALRKMKPAAAAKVAKVRGRK